MAAACRPARRYHPAVPRSLRDSPPLDAAYARLERVTRTLDLLAQWEASRLAPELFPAQVEPPTGLSRETLLSLRSALLEVIGVLEARERRRLADRRN